jgi:hypothetical protein
VANQTKNKFSQPINLIFIGGSLISIFFWTNLNDPFNSPKSWILHITGMWLLGWLCFQFKEFTKVKTLRGANFVIYYW